MNKSELIEALANRNKKSQETTPDEDCPPEKIASTAVHFFIDNIKLAFAERDRVEIRGWGSFFLKEYEEYIGRNPKTGEKVKVPKIRITCISYRERS